MVTECPGRAEGILGESRGNGSVQDEPPLRNESETGWWLLSLEGVPPGGGLGGQFLGSLLLSQTSFILTDHGVYLQQSRQCQGTHFILQGQPWLAVWAELPLPFGVSSVVLLGKNPLQTLTPDSHKFTLARGTVLPTIIV